MLCMCYKFNSFVVVKLFLTLSIHLMTIFFVREYVYVTPSVNKVSVSLSVSTSYGLLVF